MGPGMLVAATGVGAGDLATATLAGAQLGTAVLWAVLVGAALKFVLNEGLTRWQLATGTTLLQGAVQTLGRPVLWGCMLYLVVWSYLVAMALMSACGVAAQAIYPLYENPVHGKIAYGILHSGLAAALVLLGGYKLFERVMSVCIGVMFVVVVATAVVLRPSWPELLSGLMIPRIPQLNQGGLGWTVALLGGVGGTVTMLCYGYWIREEGRCQLSDLPTCRIDLAMGYAMTAVFGLAMVVIGSQLGALDAAGATLVIRVAETLETRLGSAGTLAKWSFLAGAWGAVFSSLLGVWQSVPYLFTDFWHLLAKKQLASEADEAAPAASLSGTGIYRLHLAALASVPISGLILFNFSTAMQVNGIVGALFIPLLAGGLLWLCGSSQRIGPAHAYSLAMRGMLWFVLALFTLAGVWQITGGSGGGS